MYVGRYSDICALFSGNHYGTPKPSVDSSSPVRNDGVIPGAHPSSEGKRRRNRSNVEAMAAKHNNPDNDSEREVEREPSTSGEFVHFVQHCQLVSPPWILYSFSVANKKDERMSTKVSRL